MRLLAVAIASVLAFLPASAGADTLIDNVLGISVSKDGRLEDFNGLLIAPDGRIAQVLKRGDKRPQKVDYRLDGRGRVLIPGLIDSHVEVMKLGFSLLAREANRDIPDLARPRPEDRDLAFARAQAYLLEQGITTVADIGTTIEDWQTYRRAGDLGTLQMRIIAYADGVEAMALIGGPGPTPWLYEDRLRLAGLALRLDGDLGTRTAWLAEPYADAPQTRGRPELSETQLKNLMSRGAIDNFQIAVLASGDAATSAVLDAIAELTQTYKGERRWRIERARRVDPARLNEINAYGIVFSVQPEDAAQWAVTETRLGPDRLAGADAWRSLADAGAVIAFGSGAPQGMPRPFAAMSTAMTRRDASGHPFAGWQASEKLSREVAFAGFTSAAAHAIFAEGRLGRLAPGSRADFLLVDRDPFMTTTDELAATRVLQTWVGGRLVFDALTPDSEAQNQPADR
ncbi:MAG: amidohydrolase family protein [Novosphingobium sp.]|nr:amidohydrolase family protein [Novosphingobium sp.]